MWNANQLRAFQRALSVCDTSDPRIQALEKLSEHSPAIRQRVEELRLRCDQLRAIAQTAIMVHTQMTQGQS